MKNEEFSAAPRAWGIRAVSAFAIISTSFVLGWPRALATSGTAAANQLLTTPLGFEPNQGQAASRVQFLSHGSGYSLSLAPGEAVLKLERPSASAKGQRTAGEASAVDPLRMSLIGANAEASATGMDRQTGVVNYFIGNGPKNWRSGIPTYGKVGYKGIYPGVDLVFYGNRRQLEYDFVVAPGADPSRIAMAFSGANPKLDRDGNVLLSLAENTVTLHKPVLYQAKGSNRKVIDGAYVIAGARVHLRIGPYDRSQPLVIDPVISYLTYLGGKTGNNGNVAVTSISCRPGACPPGFSPQEGQGIAVDSSGNVYVAGETYAVDFPTENPIQATNKSVSQWTAYVTKLNPTGTGLVYSTYLGGTGNEEADAIAIDASGNAYVVGTTFSGDFPTTPGSYISKCPYQGGGITYCQSNGGSFLTKLSPVGQLVYSTYVTTVANTGMPRAVAVDSQGRAYVTGDNSTYGNSASPSTMPGLFIPTTANAVMPSSLVDQAFNPHTSNPGMAFLEVFSADGSRLAYATLYGDSNPSAHGGYGDQTLNWTRAAGVAVDSAGNFYLAGNTADPNIPVTPNAFQTKYVAFTTAYRTYVAKFSPIDSAGGPRLVYSTYLGAMNTSLNASDEIHGIAADAGGSAIVTGLTQNPGFPTTPGTYDPGPCGTLNGGYCQHGAFLTKFTPDGTALAWSTLVSDSHQVKGTGYNGVQQIMPPRLDPWGNIYVEVQSSRGYPEVNPVQTFTDDNGKVGITKFDSTASTALFSTLVGGTTGQTQYGASIQYPAGLDVDPQGNIYVAGMTSGGDMPATPDAFQTTFPLTSNNYTAFVSKISPPTAPQITVTGSSAAVFNAATLQTGGIAPNEFISLKGSGLGPATGVTGLSTQLGGASVSIGEIDAYLTYAQDGQINVLVPFHVSGLSNTTIQVKYNGVVGNSVTVPVVGSSPGIFTQQYGPGQAWAVNQDLTFNSASNAAPRGTYVAFWVTGQGLVSTTLSDGTQPAGPVYPAPLLPVSVSLGGVTLPAANIAFDGLIYTGEVQINVLIPANAPTGGAVPLVVTIGGAASRSDATIAIR